MRWPAARGNIEVVVGRLREQGYRFHTNDEAREPVVPFRPPGDEAAALGLWLETRFGPIPMVVSSWLRLVGEVWLVGTHPSWPESMWGWRGTDFTFFGDQPRLRRIQVEATRQLVSPEGLQRCPQLEYVELLDLRATDLAPLAQASRLQHLWILGDPRITDEAVLDLADLADLPELTQLRIGFGGTIATLAPLTGPMGRRLRDFRIRGTKVGDDDLRPCNQCQLTQGQIRTHTGLSDRFVNTGPGSCIRRPRPP